MKKLFLLILILTFISCGKTQKNKVPVESNEILTVDQMTSILVDIHFIEAEMFIKQNSGKDVKYYTKYYYKYLTTKYNITFNQFKANINYYSSHIKDLEKIYEQVVNTISLKNGEIYKK